MFRKIIATLFLYCVSLSANAQSVNTTKNWYFGYGAALTFTTNPPTLLTNSSMSVVEGCASVSDNNANLLFYTDGGTIYDKTHSAMANGTGLSGTTTPSQSSLIMQQPGNPNNYYVFTLSNGTGLKYSIVDISLASGNGSVIAKNVPVFSGYVEEKLTGTKHCNGTDYWIAIKTYTSATQNFHFLTYQLTSAGVNTVPVMSAAANSYTWINIVGCMKISPNGKKIAYANYNNNTNQGYAFHMYDFDNSTGVVTNSLGLLSVNNNTVNWGGYGVEFSPDGTKLYGSRLYNNSNNTGGIFQWDLCAGSPSAVAASETVVAIVTSTNTNWFGSLQLASDGKIYCARYFGNQTFSISAINNPNLQGSACNYVANAVSISPYWSIYGLPNFMGHVFVQPPPVSPFTYTASNAFGCQSAMFTPPITPNTTLSGCASSGYSLVSLQWNFGDPASGANNTSTQNNPVHAFTTLGTYTTMLILNYSCGGGTDTLRQQVVINQPCISVTSTSITCAHLGSATVSATGGIGPYTYTWMPSNQSGSVATGLSPGTYTLTVFDFGNNFTYTATTLFTSLIPLTGQLHNQTSLLCHAVNNGTANYTNITGGSNQQNYLWTNGTTSVTTATVNVLSAGLWSATVTDALTGCQVKDIFLVTQPPAQIVSISMSNNTTCVNTSIDFTASTFGGTGPTYNFSWTAGPATDTHTVTRSVAGTFVYTVTSRDGNNCPQSQTVSIDFIGTPTLSIVSTSICPLETGTITGSGATNYTWSTPGSGATMTDNPMSTTVYTLTGESLLCTSSITGTITLKVVPSPTIVSNSPVCNGQALTMVGSGGASYVWTGPQNFTANVQSASVNTAAPNNSGAYNVTVTGVNSCTAPLTVTLTVNPTPTISASGSTICTTQTMQLFSNSEPGAFFSWTGPLSYTALTQNPTLPLPAVNRSGNYTVVATSIDGCTNTAITNITVTAFIPPTISSNSPRCETDQLALSGSGGVSYQWNGPGSFSSLLQNPVINGVQLNSNGVFTLVATTGPCVSSSTMAVVVHPLPVPTSTYNAPVCETKQLVMLGGSSNTITTWMWSGPAGYLSSQQYPKIDTTQLKNSGFYTLTVVDSHGCAQTRTMQVTIQPNPVLTTVGTTVCLMNEATLRASGAASYYWTGPFLYTSFSQTATINKATSASISIYTVMGTAPNSCTSIATASLHTWPLPVPTISVSSNAICVNKYITMSGEGGKFYHWDGPGGFRNDGQQLTMHASNENFTGIYSLTVTDDKLCHATTSTSITIHGLPAGYLNASKMEGCVPFCSDMNFVPSIASAPLIHAGFTVGRSSYNQTFSHCFTEAGNHVITANITDINGCVSNPTYVVHVWEKPVADFDFDPKNPVETLDEVQFTDRSAGTNNSKFKWYVGEYEGKVTPKSVLPDFTSPTFARNFKNAGIYPVALIVTNDHGCSDTTLKTIRIEADFVIYVPNAFTPNGDGKNDVFIPVTRALRKYRLMVFDRFGTMIFDTVDSTQGWDGTIGGEPCKDDVYAWKLILSSVEGEPREMAGSVLLYR